MKKILTIISAVLTAISALADEFNYRFEGNTITYNIVDEEARTCEAISSPIGLTGKVILPAHPKSGQTEYTLVGVQQSAFNASKAVTALVVPNTVTYMSKNAFSACPKLESLTIEDGEDELELEINTFSGSPLKEVYLGRNISYPTSKDSGSSPFEGHNSIKKVTLGINVTTIPGYMFAYCGGLESIDLPASLTKIGQGAFQYCTSLTDVRVPEMVTVIGHHAFSHCESLASINFPEGVTAIAYDSFEYCYSLKSVSIPESVTLLGGGAFKDCLSLESVDIRANVSVLDEYIFSYCPNLKDVKLPATLTRIALRAFYDCSSLEYIKTPDAVTEIEYEAFWGCVNLKEISLSADLKTIGFSSFKYCRALKHLDCPASLTTISQYALAECTSLETVNFGESLSVIDDHAFEGCSALKGVEFPSALMKIGNSAFYGCSLIKNIDLPASINTVRAYAFLSCTALETVSIHSGSYLHFGESAFSCCPNISVVNCYNAKPTNCDSSLFSKNVYESASLNVPAGSTSLYKVTMPWYNFVSINELGCYDAALDADDAIDFNAPLEVFTLNGSKAGDTVTGLPTGTYIIRQNFCTVKYIVR